jgi:hypothetical protein
MDRRDGLQGHDWLPGGDELPEIDQPNAEFTRKRRHNALLVDERALLFHLCSERLDCSGGLFGLRGGNEATLDEAAVAGVIGAFLLELCHQAVKLRPICSGVEFEEQRAGAHRFARTKWKALTMSGTSLVTCTPCTVTSVPTVLTCVCQTSAAVATATTTGGHPARGGSGPSPPYVRQARWPILATPQLLLLGGHPQAL